MVGNDSHGRSQDGHRRRIHNVASILRLQRSIGNAGVGWLLSRQPAPPPPARRFGLDWSVARPPSDKALAAAGVTFACRYLSHSPAKNLKLLEANHLSSLGIDLVVVWETTANRALAGHDAGVADATEALRQANHLGMPDDRPIYKRAWFWGTAAYPTSGLPGGPGACGGAGCGTGAGEDAVRNNPWIFLRLAR